MDRSARRSKGLVSIALGAAVLGSLASGACTYEGPAPTIGSDDVHLTLLHTADWHSRLFPYDFTVGQVDENLGLVPDNGPFGGAARMSYLLERERARSSRVLHLDSGDCFQGAPIFNFYNGEAETRALSETGIDAMVIGNHEFDAGGENFARQMFNWADFPVLAANYSWDPTTLLDPTRPAIGRLAQPYTILNAEGLRVGVIGMGNLSSLTSIFDQPNRLGIIPIDSVQIAQHYIDLLRPQVDVIVMLTHSGVTSDENLVERTSGIDVLLGGHLHIVLNPPKIVQDCARVDEDGRHYIEYPSGSSGTRCLSFDADGSCLSLGEAENASIRRYCRQRDVVLAHSGAFMKFLGRLDLIFSNVPERVQPEGAVYPDPPYDQSLDGYEVLSHSYALFPLDNTIPEEPRMAEMLEPYGQKIKNLIDLDLLAGYAPAVVRRFGPRGGDSALGNLISDAMWLRLGIQTDFALTNTTGIRSDLVPGAVSVEQIFNVFPFDNTVTKMLLSGREVRELFDFVARRSAQRGCNAQTQIAGARVEIDCRGCERTDGAPCASRIAIGRDDSTTCTVDADCGEGLCDQRPEIPSDQWHCLLPIAEDASYELATNNYIAQGGSGFRVLQRNTTQIDTRVQQRDVLIDYLRQGRPCGADRTTGTLPSCSSDGDCAAGFVCACPERAAWDGAACTDAGSCGEGGQCVLSACPADVAAFYTARRCDGVLDTPEHPDAVGACQCDARADGYESCKFLACIDDSLGAIVDNRVRMRSF